VFWFSPQLLSETFLILRRTQRCITIVITSSHKIRNVPKYQISWKSIPRGTKLLHVDGRTDMTTIIVAFRNVAEAPNNWVCILFQHSPCYLQQFTALKAAPKTFLLKSVERGAHHHHHHHHVDMIQCSWATCSPVPIAHILSDDLPRFFLPVGVQFLWPWAICHEAFCLDVVSNFFCRPAFCSRLRLYLIPLQSQSNK
jgi:hypothetical protein